MFDYLGTVELGAIMLKHKVINYDEFYNQFGYRLENIMMNDRVMKHLEKEKIYYKYLWGIIQRIQTQ